MPIAYNAMFVMKSIASVWLSFDFVNRNLEERRKFGRDYNKRATIRWVQPRESFLLRKQRGWRGGGLSARWWSSMMERYWGRGGRSRNPYLWWHNTWTAHFGAWSTDSIYAKFPIQILIFVQFFCLTFFFFFFMLFREIPQGVNFWCTNQSTVT